MKRAYKGKQKPFFIIFKRLSVAKNYLRPNGVPLMCDDVILFPYF